LENAGCVRYSAALKLSHAIAKLGQPLTYRRAWRKVRRTLHPVAMAPLLAKIDQDRLRALQTELASLPQDAPALWRHYAKYLQVEKRLTINIERAQDLDLDRLPPQQILDLGCGGGFFLFVARDLGHGGLGLDLAGVPVFDALIDLLHVERKVHCVTAFEPLPDLGRTFDLITAFATAFQGSKEDSWRWDAAEWDFFLNDLRSRLNPGGRIFLDLNAAYDGRYYTPEIFQVFVRRGARVERGKILFQTQS
jgi:SAM-dependent methyltransferase